MAKATKKTASVAAPAPKPAPAGKPAKAARRQAAPPAAAAPAVVPPPPSGTDLVSQTVMFCQEQRWREADLVCLKVLDRARLDGNEPLVQGMSGARLKIECSLRRQMAASVIEATRELLAKEFLLDVGSA